MISLTNITNNMVYILNPKDPTSFLIQKIVSLYWDLNQRPPEQMTCFPSQQLTTTYIENLLAVQNFLGQNYSTGGGPGGGGLNGL